MKVLAVVGARPNFMKMAPLLEGMRRRPGFAPVLVHTGQHYDQAMSDRFFADLGMPEPDVNLGVGGGSHAEQTAEVMRRLEPVLMAEAPDLVLVVGDVNSTMAAAVTAAKLTIPVAHVEAGLRSFDRTMPEEINRLVTDAISDYLFTTEASANENLLREGIAAGKIHFVGNVMIDTLLRMRDRAESAPCLSELGLRDGRGGGTRPYAVLTLHRPSNVDDAARLARLVTVLETIADRRPVVFPCHPRTARRLTALGLRRHAGAVGRSGLHVVEPLGYLDFLQLLGHAEFVLTDSGGIQEETTVLGVPCLTLRENTERPVTITQGTNVLVGTNPEAIPGAVASALRSRRHARRAPDLWDGHAADRILDVLSARPAVVRAAGAGAAR